MIRLVFEEPEDPSPAVADFYREWYRERGLCADRLVIESFILLEPYWTLRTGSVPFWMKFNMEPSLAWARRYLSHAEPFNYIHMMLFAHGVNSVGLPPIAAWRTLLEEALQDGSFLGVDPRSYPAHFSAFARYCWDLRKIPARYPLPEPLSLDRFERFIAKASGGYPVRIER